MKVWIDKQGGTHYHKANCKMIGKPFHYEEIEHQLRTCGYPVYVRYCDITIDKLRYSPCPICFGDKRK